MDTARFGPNTVGARLTAITLNLALPTQDTAPQMGGLCGLRGVGVGWTSSPLDSRPLHCVAVIISG